MKLIIPYSNPDLDGVACAIGYEEYLSSKAIQCKAAIFGEPQSEARFVLEKNSIPQPENAQNLIHDVDEVILVDASDTIGISSQISREKVIEVIDHRIHFKKTDFPNAKFQIEPVGAAATLIAEKFYKNNVNISTNTSLLLYSAIISNTINFKTGNTTQRDIHICDQISRNVIIPSDWCDRMFQYKSNNFVVSFESFVNNYSGFFHLNFYDLIITQIEVVDIREFVILNEKDLIDIFKKTKRSYPEYLCMFNIVDIKNGFNIFFTLDEGMMILLKKRFNVVFHYNYAVYDKVILRKELISIFRSLI